MDLTTYLQAADAPLLEAIDGAVYYELAVIICRRNGQSTIAGLARDWPLIQRSARIAELERLLAAEQAHAAEAESHVAELISRNEELTRELEEARRVPTAVAAAATGMPAPARRPGEAAKPTEKRKKCPYCNARPKAAELQAHLDQKHPDRPPEVVAVPSEPAPIVLAEPLWVCASCGQDTFARSVADPSRCISCVAHERPANGHALAAA